MKKLDRLALNEEGFIFDPATGESFTTNSTGLTIIKGLRNQKTSIEIASELSEKFDIDETEAERDVQDFTDSLRSMKLV